LPPLLSELVQQRGQAPLPDLFYFKVFYSSECFILGLLFLI
jgi:hypothetical protein